jgi:hypothetical protein
MNEEQRKYALEMDRRRQETRAKWLCQIDRHGLKHSYGDSAK